MDTLSLINNDDYTVESSEQQNSYRRFALKAVNFTTNMTSLALWILRVLRMQSVGLYTARCKYRDI